MFLDAGRRVRSLALVGAALAVMLVPGIAFAAEGGGGTTIGPRIENGATVDIVGASLESKLMATIRFTVVCDPITYFDWETYQEFTTEVGRLSADVTLLQAQGRSIATAVGFSSAVTLTCDGATVNHATVSVVAQNLPLKRGDALAGVSAWISAQGGESGENYAQSGPTAVRLGR